MADFTSDIPFSGQRKAAKLNPYIFRGKENDRARIASDTPLGGADGCICIFVIGATLGVGMPAWTGHPIVGAHGIAIYLAQTEAAEKATGGNAMGFAPVLKPALPAVVSITSSRIVKVPQQPFFNDPFFQQFFGGQFPRAPQQRGKWGWDRV